MSFVQVGREGLARSPRQIQQTEYGPQSEENQQSQGKTEKEPCVETDRLSFSEGTLPHGHQYQVDTCSGEGAHPPYGSGVCNPENHSPTEVANMDGLVGAHGQAL